MDLNFIDQQLDKLEELTQKVNYLRAYQNSNRSFLNTSIPFQTTYSNESQFLPYQEQVQNFHKFPTPNYNSFSHTYNSELSCPNPSWTNQQMQSYPPYLQTQWPPKQSQFSNYQYNHYENTYGPPVYPEENFSSPQPISQSFHQTYNYDEKFEKLENIVNRFAECVNRVEHYKNMYLQSNPPQEDFSNFSSDQVDYQQPPHLDDVEGGFERLDQQFLSDQQLFSKTTDHTDQIDNLVDHSNFQIQLESIPLESPYFENDLAFPNALEAESLNNQMLSQKKDKLKINDEYIDTLCGEEPNESTTTPINHFDYQTQSDQLLSENLLSENLVIITTLCSDGFSDRKLNENFSLHNKENMIENNEKLINDNCEGDKNQENLEEIDDSYVRFQMNDINHNQINDEVRNEESIEDKLGGDENEIINENFEKYIPAISNAFKDELISREELMKKEEMIQMFKQVQVKISLFDVIQYIPNYSQFLKERCIQMESCLPQNKSVLPLGNSSINNLDQVEECYILNVINDSFTTFEHEQMKIINNLHSIKNFYRAGIG